MAYVVRWIQDQGGGFLVSLPILSVQAKDLAAGDWVLVHFADSTTIGPGEVSVPVVAVETVRSVA